MKTDAPSGPRDAQRLGVEAFEAERAHLFAVAYRMMGSRAEAEDLVQSAWLRVMSTSPEQVDEPRAYLTTVVVRLALDALKSARVRREAYVGPWLPEPIQEGPAPERDPASISLAFLVLLEALSPLERAAFLLHEVFDWTAPEIGRLLGRDEVAVRQLVARARAHVREGAPRYAPSKAAHEQMLQGFLMTTATGDVNALAALLAENAKVISDGGGVVKAARKVVVGRMNAAKLMLGVLRHGAPSAIEIREVNGWPSVVWKVDGVVAGVLSIETDGQTIHAIHLVNNPEKLGGLTP